jgi:hypothetical protein
VAAPRNRVDSCAANHGAWCNGFFYIKSALLLNSY